MKKIFLTVLLSGALMAIAQPARDTTLKEQKENIIKETTIIQVENLGAVINTQNPEMRPTISADGNLLFFIRQNDPANIAYSTVPNSQDIWYSTRDSTGKWSRAKHVSEKINASQCIGYRPI
jgi:OmpA-OmpF porin, OOP family